MYRLIHYTYKQNENKIGVMQICVTILHPYRKWIIAQERYKSTPKYVNVEKWLSSNSYVHNNYKYQHTWSCE